jgi:Protein of unknown function (DUF4242)
VRRGLSPQCFHTKPSRQGRYLVEWYWPGLTEPGVTATVRQVRQAAAGLTEEGCEITYVTAFLVPDDEVAFCVVDAGSVGSVEEACRRAELRFDRILEVVQIDSPEGDADR